MRQVSCCSVQLLVLWLTALLYVGAENRLGHASCLSPCTCNFHNTGLAAYIETCMCILDNNMHHLTAHPKLQAAHHALNGFTHQWHQAMLDSSFRSLHSWQLQKATCLLEHRKALLTFNRQLPLAVPQATSSTTVAPRWPNALRKNTSFSCVDATCGLAL